MEKIYFFVHYHGALAREDNRERHANNFGFLFHECISSPFLLYKTHLELTCRIVFTVVDKEILPLFLSELRSSYRSLTVCNYRYCLGSRKDKVKHIIFKEVTIFYLRIIEISCDHVDPSFVK